LKWGGKIRTKTSTDFVGYWQYTFNGLDAWFVPADVGTVMWPPPNLDARIIRLRQVIEADLQQFTSPQPALIGDCTHQPVPETATRTERILLVEAKRQDKTPVYLAMRAYDFLDAAQI